MRRRSGFILTLKLNGWGVEMKRFVVTFSETVERQVVIEAKDEEMAQYKVIDDRGSWGNWVRKPITTDVIVTRVVEKEEA
jgi:hypothetical protein